MISKGEIILVEDKAELMHKLGKKHLKLQLAEPLAAIPDALKDYGLALSDDGQLLTYTYDTKGERTGITTLMKALTDAGVRFKDLPTYQRSLEEIFVGLQQQRAGAFR